MKKAANIKQSHIERKAKLKIKREKDKEHPTSISLRPYLWYYIHYSAWFLQGAKMRMMNLIQLDSQSNFLDTYREVSRKKMM